MGRRRGDLTVEDVDGEGMYRVDQRAVQIGQLIGAGGIAGFEGQDAGFAIAQGQLQLR